MSKPNTVEELKEEIQGYLSITARTTGLGEAIHVDGRKSGRDRSGDRKYVVGLVDSLIEAVRREERESFILPGHKCTKIAEVDTKLDDREIWLGRLDEVWEPSPSETHAIHIQTPFKKVVLGVNESDSWWLTALAQIVFKENTGKYMIKEQQTIYAENCIERVTPTTNKEP